MKKAMAKIVVPVSFTGTVEVEIPAAIPPERRETLASKVALTRLLATTENPDAPEDDACAEYEAESKLDEEAAGAEWDGCATKGVNGKWSLWAEPTADDRTAVVERLAKKAESAGLQPEDLDEIVHDLASGAAADINNGGVEDQVRYLVEGLGIEQAERQIDELIEGQPKKGE